MKLTLQKDKIVNGNFADPSSKSTGLHGGGRARNSDGFLCLH